MLKLFEFNQTPPGYVHHVRFSLVSSKVVYLQNLGLSGQVPQNNRTGGHAPGELHMACL